MFRRLPHTLPQDPTFPPDLETLGLFVNDDDQIRMIADPTRKYQYKINKNERINVVYKQANNSEFNVCQMDLIEADLAMSAHKAAVTNIVQERLSKRGLKTVRLPLGAREDENHLPVLASEDIATKDRVIVYLGERHVEPGIVSWRAIGEEGIKVGSLLDFCDAALFAPTATARDDAPGILIANPCQIVWYRGGSRAVSMNEWLALPRPSAVHEPMRIDEVMNRIPSNHDYEEHVCYIFDHVLPSLAKEGAQIEVIGVEYTGARWSTRITGIALVSPQHNIQDLIELGAPDQFTEFISKRCRAYLNSHEALEVPMTGRDMFGCNCYASGESDYEDRAFTRSWRSILDWFNILRVDPDIEEATNVIRTADQGDEPEQLGW